MQPSDQRGAFGLRSGDGVEQLPRCAGTKGIDDLTTQFLWCRHGVRLRHMTLGVLFGLTNDVPVGEPQRRGPWHACGTRALEGGS
jgi:hypothetical protein